MKNPLSGAMTTYHTGVALKLQFGWLGTWLRGTVVRTLSLTGELSLSHAQHAADG